MASRLPGRENEEKRKLQTIPKGTTAHPSSRRALLSVIPAVSSGNPVSFLLRREVTCGAPTDRPAASVGSLPVPLDSRLRENDKRGCGNGGLAKVSLGAREVESRHSMKLKQYQSDTPSPPPLRGRARVGDLELRPGLGPLPWFNLPKDFSMAKKDRK